MELGMVGLGKMGASMTTRLLTAGHDVVVTDRNPGVVRVAAEGGAVAAESLQDLVSKLSAPRAVWIMVPSGAPTESVVQELSECLDAGDIVVDGGNSNYKETMRRGQQLDALVHNSDRGRELAWPRLPSSDHLAIRHPERRHGVENLAPDPCLDSLCRQPSRSHR